MKICVFGAGAIGGLVAVRLAQVSGLAISVVARGAQLAAMREHGLRLHSPAGDLQARVQATDRAEELGVQDVVYALLELRVKVCTKRRRVRSEYRQIPCPARCAPNRRCPLAA
jgi:hypothetical protein